MLKITFFIDEDATIHMFLLLFNLYSNSSQEEEKSENKFWLINKCLSRMWLISLLGHQLANLEFRDFDIKVYKWLTLVEPKHRLCKQKVAKLGWRNRTADELERSLDESFAGSATIRASSWRVRDFFNFFRLWNAELQCGLNTKWNQPHPVFATTPLPTF